MSTTGRCGTGPSRSTSACTWRPYSSCCWWAVQLPRPPGTVVSGQAAGLGMVLFWSTRVAGAAALVLMALGSLALLVRRLGDRALREFSSPADLFNLVFFAATAAVALAAFAVADLNFDGLRGYMQGLITFQFAEASVHPLIAAEIVMGAVLLAYIPLTHMSHFFTKFFTTTTFVGKIGPNMVGSAIEAKLQKQLSMKVDWSAPHINGGGTKTWVDVATEEVAKK